MLEEETVGEKPHYKISVLGDEALSEVPNYDPDVLVAATEYGEEGGMEDLG